MKEWNYKGYQCRIDYDHDSDGFDHDSDGFYKAFHEVVTPEGKRLFANITPYDDSKEVLEMWVDAGCPGRLICGNCSRNYNKDSLQTLLAN